MSLNATSLAPAVGASVINTQFASEAQNLPRKILCLGTYLSTVADIVDNEPLQVLNAEDAGYRAGFGSMLHRLALQAFRGGQGVPVFLLPQAEPEGAAAATGSVNFTTSIGIKACTLHFAVAGIPVDVTVAAGTGPGPGVPDNGAGDYSEANLAAALIAAINADKNLPVSAAGDGGDASIVHITAKSAGPWGNYIDLAFNIKPGQALPAGVVATVTGMSGGAGIPDVATALEGLGTGDGANEAYFTDVCHGYGQDATTLDAISTYVGAGNDALGLYSETVGRPFRALTGDTDAGSQGLTDLVALAVNRKLDRANGVIAVPGSATHPAEIAAQVIGHMARINQDRVAQHYLGLTLIDVDPGAKVDRWTNDYDNRDTAVKAGISPTRVQNGVVTLQTVITFYRPDNVPVASNGYRSMRNIAIIQNLLFNIRLNFEQEKWQGIFIVADTAAVTNLTDRQKARDVDTVIDDLIALTNSFASHGWIYEAAFTINKLKQGGMVAIRPGGLGFDNVLPVLLSGEGGILDTRIEFDTSLAVLLG